MVHRLLIQPFRTSGYFGGFRTILIYIFGTQNPGSLIIPPATICKSVTEKIIKRRPVMAPVNSSLPFLTCSALSPPVMIWTVATNMITREIAPAVPARKVRRAEVKPEVLTGRQPSAVSMAWSPQLPVGSKASDSLGARK